MSDKVWKAFERKWSKLFGGSRNPLSGSNSRHGSGDMIHDEIYLECKYRKKHCYIELFKDTEDKADKEQKFPIVLLQQKGLKTVYTIAPLKLDYLKRLVNYMETYSIGLSEEAKKNKDIGTLETIEVPE